MAQNRHFRHPWEFSHPPHHLVIFGRASLYLSPTLDLGFNGHMHSIDVQLCAFCLPNFNFSFNMACYQLVESSSSRPSKSLWLLNEHPSEVVGCNETVDSLDEYSPLSFNFVTSPSMQVYIFSLEYVYHNNTHNWPASLLDVVQLMQQKCDAGENWMLNGVIAVAAQCCEMQLCWNLVYP